MIIIFGFLTNLIIFGVNLTKFIPILIRYGFSSFIAVGLIAFILHAIFPQVTQRSSVPPASPSVRSIALLAFWLPVVITCIIATIWFLRAITVRTASDGQVLFVFVIVPIYGIPIGIFLRWLVIEISRLLTKR